MNIDERDQQIDRAFHSLGQVEPPQGMEERILRQLAQQSTARTTTRWQPRRLILAAALSAAALAVAVAVLHHRGEPIADRPIVAQTQPTLSLPAAPTTPHAKPDSYHVAKVKRASASFAEEASFPAPPAPLTDQEKLLVRLAKAQQRTTETAPQLATAKQADVPLTHEEALLVAVSRVRQDAVLDALDPVRRAEADARQKREFNTYVQEKDGGS